MKILLTILLASLSFLSKATLLYGGSISYTCVGNQQWKIKLEVMSECTPSGLCPQNNPVGCTQPIIVKPNSNLNPIDNRPNVSSSFTLTLVKVEDFNQLELLQLGQIAKNSCTNYGTQTAGSYSIPLTVHTFEGIINLSSYALNYPNCNYWDVIYVSGSRFPFHNLGGQALMTVFSTINNKIGASSTEGLKNNSPLINNSHFYNACAGQPIFNNLAAIDPDGDSLSYYLEDIYEMINTSLLTTNYNIPFNNKNLFPQNLTALPYTDYPSQMTPSIIMNSTTGDFAFNALNNTSNFIISSLSIGIKQWRKLTNDSVVLIGVYRKEMPVFVKNCIDKSSLVLKNNTFSFKQNYTVTSHDTLIINFDLTGSKIGLDANTDTTKIINIWGTDTSFYWQRSSLGAQGKATLKYKPHSSKINTTQTFTILGIDNSLPLGVRARQIQVKVVTGNASLTISKTIDSCGSVNLSYRNPLNVDKVNWEIAKYPSLGLAEGNIISFPASGVVTRLSFDSIGRYAIRAAITRVEPDYGVVFVYDTIEIRKPTFPFHISDTTICKNSLLTVSLPSGSYTWRNLTNMFTKNTSNIFTDTIVSSVSYLVTGTLTEQLYQGCLVSDTLSVAIHAEPTTSLLEQYNICPYTSITLNAKPTNIDSVSYLWSTNQRDSSINVATTGNYSVIITNLRNGCSTEKKMQIKNGNITPLFLEKQFESCKGDSVRLIASGADLYTWKANNTNLSNLAYCDVKPDSNLLIVVQGKSLNQGFCDKTDTMRLIVIPKVNFSGIIGNKTPYLNTFQVYTTHVNPKYRYTWESDGGVVQQETDSSASISWQNLGSNVIKITASHPNCKSTIFVDSVMVLQQVGLKENVVSDYQLFPNPANQSLSIITHQPISELEVFDISSKLVKTVTVFDEQLFGNIDVSALSNGIYSVKIKTKNNLVFISRFCVAH